MANHLPDAKRVAVLALLAEGRGVREVARLAGVNRETVAKIRDQAAATLRETADKMRAASDALRGTKRKRRKRRALVLWRAD